ncbi:unnamed protein product [Rotaria sordida]|uniref:Uncharacterized protein n=1 Tax=Rotaria sordida TaxID=392033 RepID=A0A818KGS0_9BILA|nr:unnamed protein product [Rotaria sordida]CAF0914036.1 unnamed protein product [Rotaria sordida]CAF0967497.1 unnamed protein product [Rotaria sordida]CAF1150087.1 unnamed protein product [Rotaria sordida]CAF3543554.1 unnamed protein product [Rotaria sordida]
MRIFTVFINVLFLVNYISSDNILLTRKLITNLSSNSEECTNTSQCLSSNECTTCENNRGPDCDQVTCINGKCNIIKQCSQEILSTTTTKTSSISNQCKGTDASVCIFDKLCTFCLRGYSPTCAEAICVNDQCKIISPCSIYTSTTQPSRLSNECKNDDECPYSKICADECENGTRPLCATRKCVNNVCQIILPCSQQICTTRATCPYNERNCSICPKGYEPICEQSVCSYGVCSIVPPCSKIN